MADSGTSGSSDSSVPKAKHPRRDSHFDRKWIQEFPGIAPSTKGNMYARCSSDFNISHGGRNDVSSHVQGKHHWEMSKASSSSRSIASMFKVARFPKLFYLMAGLLSIPVYNTDSERGFSILRKIHTDQRSNLNQSTIIALMTLKFNSDDCCHDTQLSQELLSRCKKATLMSLGKQ